ncbi:serine hydrolase domain-containing protein [Bianquea renquensis]|uniref:Beta-lactamase family protein n=1 Tax=Bianquea renquensis TaxID=2763661 RepID=A0A926DWJ9_9FIRM|nr:serine hydrolase domain-containing protein [Bianquea renquensis]MBC8545188.1 beta-lactamase family protein [Bianquea renquensis]
MNSERGLKERKALDGQFDGTLQEILAVSCKNNAVPGASVVTLDIGKPSVSVPYVCGVTRTGTQSPVTVDTQFMAGSLSKTITAWGVMALAKEQRIQLDNDINQYLKRWRFSYTVEQDTITPRMLLNHTSGLPPQYDRGGKSFINALDILTDSLAKKKFGTLHEFCYTSLGYTVLQMMVEDVLDKDFNSAMESLVFTPLKMRHSLFCQHISDLDACSYSHNAFGYALKKRIYSQSAAAGLITTISDFSLFLLQHLQAYSRDGQFANMTKKQIRLMHTCSRDDNCSLGFFTTRTNRHILLSHYGLNLGSHSFFMLVPDMGKGLAIFTNATGGNNVIYDVLLYWSRTYGGMNPGHVLDKLNRVTKNRMHLILTDLFW